MEIVKRELKQVNGRMQLVEMTYPDIIAEALRASKWRGAAPPGRWFNFVAKAAKVKQDDFMNYLNRDGADSHVRQVMAAALEFVRLFAAADVEHAELTANITLAQIKNLEETNLEFIDLLGDLAGILQGISSGELAKPAFSEKDAAKWTKQMIAVRALYLAPVAVDSAEFAEQKREFEELAQYEFD